MLHPPARPLLHATPLRGWMNDPNGLVFDGGRYHMFFQHDPDGIVWGPMHWGHAVSRDLVHWEPRPVALAPDRDGVVYSGSAVRRDDGSLAAFYTRVAPDGAQDQCLAESVDGGDTWHRYAGNPVLPMPSDRPDFRDPKVFRFANGPETDGHWVMLLAAGDEVWFHVSDDLVTWRHTGAFGRGHGAHGGVWETPDLIRFGDLWVLTVSVIAGGPAGGSGTQYFVGDFDGRVFTGADDPGRVRWVDHGSDFYAPQSWSGAPEPVWVGWMSNWTYARDVPATTWRGAMTLPRVLGLADADAPGGPVLAQRPALPFEGVPVEPGRLGEVRADALRIRVGFATGGASSYGVSVRVGPDEQTMVRYDEAAARLELDRSTSGPPGGAAVLSAPLHPRDGRIDLDIVVDTCSVEVFADGGRVVLTALVFPAPDARGVGLFAGDGDPVVTHLAVEEFRRLTDPF